MLCARELSHGKSAATISLWTNSLGPESLAWGNSLFVYFFPYQT